MEKSLIVLFDLDNTLIDTQRIKREIFYGTAMDFGLNETEAKELYASIRNIDGKVTLTLENFATVLSSRVEKNTQEILQYAKEKLLHLAKSLCIPGSIELLKSVQEKNGDMYVMTLGVHSWQEEKIEITRLSEFLPKEKRILPALDLSEKEAKCVALENFFGKEIFQKQIILFNDKPDETAELLQKFENMQALVRQDIQDERYTKKDFEKYAQQFKNRFFYNTSLHELEKKLNEIL